MRKIHTGTMFDWHYTLFMRSRHKIPIAITLACEATTTLVSEYEAIGCQSGEISYVLDGALLLPGRGANFRSVKSGSGPHVSSVQMKLYIGMGRHNPTRIVFERNPTRIVFERNYGFVGFAGFEHWLLTFDDCLHMESADDRAPILRLVGQRMVEIEDMLRSQTRLGGAQAGRGAAL